ncbi:hypothetical protein [Hominenteromicrobium sp.]|uniref:hypothetical protein n=1 Tax=Hominenteromicrobium sp. TaxID=3073581 RepID=UPI003AAA6661
MHRSEQTRLKDVLNAFFGGLCLGPLHPFGITGIWLSWPFGWVISSTLSLAFYLLGVWDPLKKKA